MGAMNKCDRCGTLYEPETGWGAFVKILGYNIQNMMCSIQGRSNLTIYDEVTKKPACICDDCKASFQDWVKQGDMLSIESKDAEHGM